MVENENCKIREVKKEILVDFDSIVPDTDGMDVAGVYDPKSQPEKACKSEMDTHLTEILAQKSAAKSLIEHFDSVLSDKGVLEYTCKRCTFRTKKKYSIQRHMARHGMSRYLCSICGKHLADAVELRDHIRFVHNNDRLKCQVCNLTFRSRQGLHQHKAVHSGDNNIAFCQLCSKQFASVQSFKLHKQAKHEGRTYSCKYCQKVFKYRVGMNDHITVCEHNPDHENNPVKIYPCSLCDKSYKRKTTLEEHLNSFHKGILGFACEMCEKSFSSRSALHRHKKKDCYKKGDTDGVVVDSMIAETQEDLVIVNEGSVELNEPQGLTFYVVEGSKEFDECLQGESATLVVREILEDVNIQQSDISHLL